MTESALKYQQAGAEMPERIYALAQAEKNCLYHDRQNRDTEDDLHKYMNLWDRWNWTDVATEGRRLWNAMFADEIEYRSAKDGLIAAVAAQGADGVWAAVAAMLGVDKNELMDLAFPWYHDQDRRPEPIAADQLGDYIRDAQADVDPEPLFTGIIGE